MSWVPIPGYEGRFEFDPDGDRVRSTPRKIKRQWVGSLSYKKVGGVVLKPIIMKKKGKCYKLADENNRQRVFSLDEIREMVNG